MTLKAFVEDSRTQLLFGLAVLLVLFLLVSKQWGWFEGKSAAAKERLESRQMYPYSSGATMRVLGQEPSDFTESDNMYVDEIRAQQMRADEAARAAEKAAAEAAQDALAVSASNAGTGEVAAVERMTAERGYPSVTGIERRFIEPAGHEWQSTWRIGDDISELKHEVSGQSPDLATNRWTMQLQNQTSDLRSDTIEGQLIEDTLFQQSLLNL